MSLQSQGRMNLRILLLLDWNAKSPPAVLNGLWCWALGFFWEKKSFRWNVAKTQTESKLNHLFQLGSYRVLLRWKVHWSLMALVLLATITVIVHPFIISLFLSSFQLSPQQERKRPLTVWSKVCFAIGGAPYQITGTALGFFLQIFLLDVALVSIQECYT